jgi:hypothetical protein
LDKLVGRGGVVKYVTAQRMKLCGHLNRTGKTKTVGKITELNPTGKRVKGRPKNRWKDEVLNDLKTLNAKNWAYLVKERHAWYGLVQKAKTQKGM